MMEATVSRPSEAPHSTPLPSRSDIAAFDIPPAASSADRSGSAFPHDFVGG